MNKSRSFGCFASRGINRLALIMAAAVLPVGAQVASVMTVATLSSSLNPSPAAQALRLTAQLDYTPADGVYPTGTITFTYADSGNVLGTANVQTFGSSTALTTQASIVVSTLSAGSYAIQASYSGDNVYAASSSTLNQVETAPAVGITPTINGVVSGASFVPGIAAGSWVSIFGSGLADVADPGVSGLADEIANGFLPTSLRKVSVTINGQNAYIAFVSREQINVQAPDDAAQGQVRVVVTNNGAVSAPFTAQLQAAAPGLFQLGATGYPVVTRYPDNALIGNPSVVPGAVAAKPGDTLTLWVTGLGPTQPPAPPGQVVTASAPTASPVTVTVGSTSVNVLEAATTSESVGMYRIDIQLPQSIGSGDQPVVATVAGFQSPTGVNLFIAN